MSDPKRIRHNPDGLVVNPHSHAYNFTTHVLKGAMTNVIFDRVKGLSWYEFEIVDRQTLYQGNWYSLDHNQIHSIRLHFSCPTILFLYQHADPPDVRRPLSAVFQALHVSLHAGAEFRDKLVETRELIS